jgi:sugar phosphate permease
MKKCVNWQKKNFLIPVTEYLSISRADFSLALSAKTITAMVATFLSGVLIARFGCRITATFGLILAGISYLFFANAESYSMLVIGGALLGITYGFCYTAGVSQSVRLWFHRHEGTVLGVVMAASGLGGSALAIVQTALMGNGSFRDSFFFCAVASLLTAVLVFIIVRNRPEDKGLQPYGEGERIRRKRKVENLYAGPAMTQLWKCPAFYLLCFCVLLSTFSVNLAFTVICPYLQDYGFSTTQASGLYSTMMLLLAGTKILVGICSDKLGARKVNLICISLGAASLLLLSFVRNYTLALVSVILYSMALPLTTIIAPLIARSLFGYRAEAQYVGVFVGLITVSDFAAAYATNLLYDATGSYHLSFRLGVLLAVLSFGLYLLVYRMADKIKRQYV